MDRPDLLERAAEHFGDLLASVTDDDWSGPTPCDEWDVGDLIDHVIGGNRFTVEILAGATADDAITSVVASFEGGTPDRAAAFRSSADRQVAAISEPGALDRMCHHPSGDYPGEVILGFRLGDLVLHGWDLARAIGADERIDPELVEAVWAEMEPRAHLLAATGRFGEGHSGTVAEDASLQDRLLDLAGRRP